LKKFKFQKTQKKLDKYNRKPFKTAKLKPEKTKQGKTGQRLLPGPRPKSVVRGRDAFQRARGR
jgi:hypothetical protein